MTDKDQKWMAEDFEEVTKNAEENFENNIEEKFGKGTFGHHELIDHVWILCENWENYILNHLTLTLDKELFKKAWEVNQILSIKKLVLGVVEMKLMELTIVQNQKR